MSRLSFFCVLLFSLVSDAAWAAEAPPKKPNILFCFADDWGRYASAYAAVDGERPSLNQVVKTPHIDRLAAEGVLFRNAFVPAPSCTPCRSSLLSGRYFWNTGRGAILEGAEWEATIPSWPLALRDAGWHIGKSHKVWSPGKSPDAPYGGQRYAYERGREVNNFSENATRIVESGETVATARERMLAQVRTAFDAFLADRKEGQPWGYFFGATTTHRKWVRGSGKALWGIEPDLLKGKLPAFLPDVPEVREDVADYLGEVQAWDAYIGVLYEQLAAVGELDNTLIVVSGDHGMPGVPRGKCNLYDFGTGVTLAARVPGGKAGRVVDDFVNIMDLAPTFLEAAGIAPPAGMNARSLWPVLASEQSGQVDPERTWVITGRERHVANAREESRPYPMRALRTRDFLYIRNFAPDRWPLGAPGEAADAMLPEAKRLENETRAAFPDMDASPTKAWLIAHRDDPQWKRHYDFAFAKRPAEELYDLRKDQDQVENVADHPEYTAEKQKLAEQLLRTLAAAHDPRAGAGEPRFEQPPYTDPGRSAK